jgi:hypothetical protein
VTHQTVLANRSNLGVRSVKGSRFGSERRNLKLWGFIWKNLQDTRLDLLNSRSCRGDFANPVGLISFLRDRGSRRPGRLLALGGAGDYGGQGLDYGAEPKEEVEGRGSPRARRSGSGRKMAGGDVDGRVGPPGAAALLWTPDDEERCNTCGSVPRSSRWRRSVGQQGQRGGDGNRRRRA